MLFLHNFNCVGVVELYFLYVPNQHLPKAK
uniref:Uncharacterized protein n=1 Tax=Pyramimonas orientalis virus TaxID=455367 RepID=A0A7M3UP09_POV01|nr:hypothetical protein HWQ62_00326 [Pyramimonas orientalis virus]